VEKSSWRDIFNSVCTYHKDSICSWTYIQHHCYHWTNNIAHLQIIRKTLPGVLAFTFERFWIFNDHLVRVWHSKFVVSPMKWNVTKVCIGKCSMKDIKCRMSCMKEESLHYITYKYITCGATNAFCTLRQSLPHYPSTTSRMAAASPTARRHLQLGIT